MDSRENVADLEKLDQATKQLIASLEQSKALNSRIRKTLRHGMKASAIDWPERGRDADVFRLLDEIARNLE
jgi:hypothetical protein